jgi:hypothetical protein
VTPSLPTFGYNTRNDEIRDNVTRMRREWEAQRGSLSTVRRFNATLSEPVPLFGHERGEYALNDVMILSYDANLGRMEFSEGTGPSAQRKCEGTCLSFHPPRPRPIIP